MDSDFLDCGKLGLRKVPSIFLGTRYRGIMLGMGRKNVKKSNLNHCTEQSVFSSIFHSFYTFSVPSPNLRLQQTIIHHSI